MRLKGAASPPPPPPAVINSFTSTTTTVSWNITGATSVFIDQGIGSVALIGSFAHGLTTGNYRNYTLTATIEGVTTQQTITAQGPARCIYADWGFPEWC